MCPAIWRGFFISQLFTGKNRFQEVALCPTIKIIPAQTIHPQTSNLIIVAGLVRLLMFAQLAGGGVDDDSKEVIKQLIARTVDLIDIVEKITIGACLSARRRFSKQGTPRRTK